MAKLIPTRRGDVLILWTSDKNFSIYAVGLIANDGEQDFFTGENVQYVRDRSAAEDAARNKVAPGKRIFFRNLDTGYWSDISN